MVAPLNFDAVKSVKKADRTEQTAAPKLDFGSVKVQPAPPPAKSPDPQKVMTGFDPFDFTKGGAPAGPLPPPPSKPAAPTAGKLDFGNVKPKQPPAPATQPAKTPPVTTAAFIDKTDSQIPDILKVCEQSFPSLFTTDRAKLELQIKQLMPITTSVVIDWGAKPLSYLAAQTQTVSQLVREIATAKINESIEAALLAITEKPNLFQRMLAKDDVVDLHKPRLSVARTNLPRWRSETDRMLNEARVTAHKCHVALASLSSVATYLGTIPDNALDCCVRDRRTLLQQAATQAQLLIAQLESQQQLLQGAKSRIDQFLDLTLPAYEAAKAK